MGEPSPVMGDSGAGPDPDSLLAKRLAWEAENPWPEPLRRSERAIVRALRDAGFGSQSQVTRSDGFDIAVDDITVRVALHEAEDRDLALENQRLRDLYENVVQNRERFGWTINHLLECEEALRTVEAVASDADRLRAALQRIADGDIPSVTFADDDLISAFAQEALDA